MAKRNIFKEASKLDFSKGYLVDSEIVGFNKDDLITIRWDNLPNKSIEQLQTWARQNRRSIDKFKVENNEYEEPYRHVRVSAKQIGGKERDGGWLEHTFARGWIQNLVTAEVVDWTEARRFQGSQPVGTNDSAAPASDVADIADTGSDDPERHLFIEFEGVDPEKTNAIALDIGALTTVDNVSAEGVAIAGTFHVISVSDTRADDGSATLRVYLAHPQFTLEAYRDFETSTAADVFYLWGVPKDLAQTIMDAWKAVSDATERPGRSATASYRSDNLVDLVLTKRATTLENLTTDIPIACDTVENHHFGWGYTKDELATFIDTHDDDLGAGVTRSMRVSNRSDGLYDVHIIETTVTYDVSKHKFEVELAIGDKIVKTETSGWNIPLADLNTLKLDYEVQTVGNINEFDVTRKDNCTFDYRATVVVSTKSDEEFDVTAGALTTDLGVDVRKQIIEAATKVEIRTQLAELDNKPGPRRSVDADVRRRPDGMYDATITETEIEKTEGSMDSGSGGIAVEAVSGDNVDADDLTDIVTSAAREHVTLSISGNDDGTFNYRATKQTVVEATDEADSGGGGVAVEVKSGRNIDAGSVAALTSGPRKRVTISLSLNDDGTVNYTSVSETSQPTTATSSSGGGGVGVTAVSGDSVDSVAGVVSSAPRTSVSLSVSGNPDGTLNYRGTETTIQPTTGEGSSGGSGVSVKAVSGDNVDSIGTPVTSAPRTSASLSVSGNPDGTFNYRGTETKIQEAEGDSGSSGSGVSVRAVSGDNVDSVSGVVSSAPRKSVSVSVSGNPDGTLNYRGTETTILPTTGESSSGGSGVSVRAVSGDNVDSIGSPVSSDLRVRAALSVSGNPDGTFNYRGTETTIQPAETDSSSGGAGVSVKAVSGDNVDAVGTPVTSDVRVRAALSVSGNPDGTFNYRGTETTVQEGSDTIEGGSVGSPVVYDVGTNTTAPAGSSPSQGDKITFQGSHNDDGTMNYVIASQSSVEQSATGIQSGSATIEENTDVSTGATSVPSGAPSQGSSYKIDVNVSKDGTFDYTAVHLSRTPVTAGISLASRNPRKERAGYSDSGTIFEGVNTIPTPGGDFYYFEGLTVESDGTFSGILHNLDLEWTEASDITSVPGTHSTLLNKVRYVNHATGGPDGRPVSYQRNDVWETTVCITKDFGAAVAAMSGAQVGTMSISGMEINGESYIRSVCSRLVYSGTSWSRITPLA